MESKPEFAFGKARSPERVKLPGAVPGPFEHRGVVEGFYGPPFSHADRLWLLERMGRWGMNRYVHAPKDDPLHRAQWRTPYPAESLTGFAELIERGGKSGVDVGFAISPGLSIEYSSADDVAALTRKLWGFRELGARFFGLFLDDVPSRLVHAPDVRAFPSLGAAHAAVGRAVAEALGDGTTVWLVPTDYLGTEATGYLEELAAGLPREVEIGWTGRTVVSPEIRREEARHRARTVGRRLLVWDNYPVADGPMRNMLHLGPLLGRDPELATHVSGFLMNPMQNAHASAVALHTAATYLRDPVAYDPETAWRAAVEDIGTGAPEAFSAFAAGHRYSALAPDQRDPELESAWRALASDLARGEPGGETRDAVADLLEVRAAAAAALRRHLSDSDLRREIEPWIESHGVETRRMQAALKAVSGIASAPDRLSRALAFFAFEGQLTRIPLPSPASYGPRRVLYPQLVSMRDDDAGLGADVALHRDRNLADEMVAAVEAWALARLEVAPSEGGPGPR